MLHHELLLRSTFSIPGFFSKVQKIQPKSEYGEILPRVNIDVSFIQTADSKYGPLSIFMLDN